MLAEEDEEKNREKSNKKEGNKKKGITLILMFLEWYVDTFCGFLRHHLQVVVEFSEWQMLPPELPSQLPDFLPTNQMQSSDL